MAAHAEFPTRKLKDPKNQRGGLRYPKVASLDHLDFSPFDLRNHVSLSAGANSIHFKKCRYPDRHGFCSRGTPEPPSARPCLARLNCKLSASLSANLRP